MWSENEISEIMKSHPIIAIDIATVSLLSNEDYLSKHVNVSIYKTNAIKKKLIFSSKSRYFQPFLV